MTLADILSMDGLLILTLVQDRVFTLRLVSRKIKMTLESNIFLKINIRINDTGVVGLKANFLQRWHGSVHLYCTRPWKPDSRWFNEISDALETDRLRPLSQLSLTVLGDKLHPLVATLVRFGSAIQRLELTYRGNGTELVAAAAPLASLGRALTMKICFQGRDHGGGQTCVWLQHLLASSISISSISLRPVHRPAPPAVLGVVRRGRKACTRRPWVWRTNHSKP
jgi:hypothetical protein